MTFDWQPHVDGFVIGDIGVFPFFMGAWKIWSRAVDEWDEIAEIQVFETQVLARYVAEALKFANDAHSAVGQTRKYDGRPYIVHPIAVAEIVRSVPHTPAMIATALLHDVVEDTGRTLAEVEASFGADIAVMVSWLTDVSVPSDGNREIRKMLDRRHTATAPQSAKTIKLADLIDNAKSIRQHDPDFWHVYRHEMQRLLGVLTDGDPVLWAQASELCACPTT